MQNDPADKEHKKALSDVLPIVLGLIGLAVCKFGKRETEEDKESPQDRAARKTACATITMAIFTALIFALGIFQFVVFYRQLGVMQRQLDDAEIKEAASITIRNLAVEGFPDNVTISFDVVNSGQTRADQVTMDPGAIPVSALHATGFLDRKDPFGGRAQASDLGFSIAPSDPPKHISVAIGAVPSLQSGIPAEERAKLPTRDDIMSGNFVTFIFVVGTYKDVFGKTQHVFDCVVYRGFTSSECFASNRHY